MQGIHGRRLIAPPPPPPPPPPPAPARSAVGQTRPPSPDARAQRHAAAGQTGPAATPAPAAAPEPQATAASAPAGQTLAEMARPPAAPSALSPIAQKSQATDRAVQSVSQARKTLEEVSAASHGRSAALPHLRSSVQQAQADLKTAVQNEVDGRLALTLAPGQRPSAADYAKALDTVTQRHQDTPGSVQLLQQAAPRHAAGAHAPAAVPDKRQSNSQADPTTPEGVQERYPDEMEGRSQQERQEAADASRQLRDGTPEEQAQALVTLNKYLPDQKMDDLTQHLGVAEQPTVQSLRRDTKAKEQMAKLANPDTPPAERADAALALAGRMQELNLLPGKVGTFAKKYVKDLPSVKDIVGSLNTLSDPNASVADKAAAALGLAKDLGSALPGKLGDTLKPFLDKLPDAKKAVEALNTLSKPDASPADKVKAGLDLASGLGGLAPKKLNEALKPYLSMLPAGTKLVDAITTWAKPDASPLEKAKAALALANAAKDSLGKAFPALAEHLRYADSTLKSVGYALTLLDPNASVKDKAEAALGLTAEVPQIAGDLEQLKSFLKENGIRASDAAQIAEEVKKLPAVNQLPEELRGKLDPEVARQLTPEQAQRLAKLHASGGDDKALGEALGKALPGLKDPASINALLDAAEGVKDKAARQGLLEALGGLKPGMADELLAGTLNGKPAAQALSDLFGKMDGDSAKKLAGMLADVDANTLRRALEMGDMVDGKLLNQVLGMVDSDNLKLAGQALTTLFGMMDNAGVKMTAEIAGKVLKGVAKAVPIGGAVVAGIDAVRMAQIAADPNVPPDIRYMAAQAAKLNTVDAALSVAEPFIAAAYGIPVAVDIAMAVAETALDVIVSDQYEKFQQQGDAYQAPDWLKAANVGLAVAGGAQGAVELGLFYGPKGATELVGSVSRMAGDAAIQAAELNATLAAQGIGEGMEMTAEGLHTLADVIRHPEKYGAMAEQMVGQALDKLGEMAKGAGQLADAARQQLTETVDYLKGLGEQGVQTLQWIATHPGEAATQAINALSDMVGEAMRMGTEAGRQLAESAMTALGQAQKALEQLGEAGAKALDAVTDAIGNVAESALAAGKQGVETLAWMLTHPGETAQMAEAALTDIMAKGGEMGKHAWDQVMALGDAGVKFAQDVIGKLGEAGAAGLEMLKYAVENPGETAEQIRQAALDGLGALANGASELANAATDAITGFVDSGIKEAQKTAKHLLTKGGAAAQRIIDTWSRELSEGGKAVIEGLKDLGDAGREALGKLANAGIAFAGEVLGRIGEAVQDAAETVVEGAQDAWNRRDEGIPHIPFI